MMFRIKRFQFNNRINATINNFLFLQLNGWLLRNVYFNFSSNTFSPLSDAINSKHMFEFGIKYFVLKTKSATIPNILLLNLKRQDSSGHNY